MSLMAFVCEALMRPHPQSTIVGSNTSIERWRVEDDWFRPRLRATERLCARIAHPELEERRDNVGIPAMRLALKFRLLQRRSTVTCIRFRDGVAVREIVPAPRSSVHVLRRMRRAVELNDRIAFLHAKLELPKHVLDRISAIGRHPNHDEAILIDDPWLLLFIFGLPATGTRREMLLPRAEILRAIDSAIAEASKPGRRVDDPLKIDLLRDAMRCWANLTQSDLRQPYHVAGYSERSGPLVEFLRELFAIWQVVISLNSGESMRREISAVAAELKTGKECSRAKY